MNFRKLTLFMMTGLLSTMALAQVRDQGPGRWRNDPRDYRRDYRDNNRERQQTELRREINSAHFYIQQAESEMARLKSLLDALKETGADLISINEADISYAEKTKLIGDLRAIGQEAINLDQALYGLNMSVESSYGLGSIYVGFEQTVFDIRSRLQDRARQQRIHAHIQNMINSLTLENQIYIGDWDGQYINLTHKYIESNDRRTEYLVGYTTRGNNSYSVLAGRDKQTGDLRCLNYCKGNGDDCIHLKYRETRNVTSAHWAAGREQLDLRKIGCTIGQYPRTDGAYRSWIIQQFPYRD